jgi:hypothetical protein
MSQTRFTSAAAVLGFAIILSSCTRTTPEEVLGDDRITLEVATAQVADAVKGFRLRLASDTLGANATKPIVPEEYRSGLMFCGVDIVFLVSAKATENGKLTLAVPATLNFAGPNPPLNTVSPSLTAERGGTSEANRSNTVTFKMVNPVCQNYDKVMAILQAHPDFDPSVLDEVRRAGYGNQALEPQR